jgi:hypothetical protein
MRVKGLSYQDAKIAAQEAVQVAQREAPKLSGQAAKHIVPVYAANEFGLTWSEDYLWFQNAGVKGFTMKSLEGKTIPMWISDPAGNIKMKNPKAKTRITESGVTQVLIFRKAVKPGAPGRIALRSMNGKIAKGNIGVRWYFPGLAPRNFLEHAINQTARSHGYEGQLDIGYNLGVKSST